MRPDPEGAEAYTGNVQPRRPSYTRRTLERVRLLTVPGSTGLNALTFDAAGNVYVSNSANGSIWKNWSLWFRPIRTRKRQPKLIRAAHPSALPFLN